MARLRKQWYDYTNKRQRLDRDDGTTKMYDYKTLVDPCPVGQCPSSRPKFPSPQGFKWQTDDMDNTCCFVWLVDSDTKEPETMDRFEVESNAKQVGSDARGDHWLSVKKFPFLQTDDCAPRSRATPAQFSEGSVSDARHAHVAGWFLNGTLTASNTYFDIPGHSPVSGYGMSNSTFSDFTTTIDPTVFDHPDSRVTFGKCKECGVDDECPMWQCMQ